MPAAFADLAALGRRASAREPGDPMEKALHAAAPAESSGTVVRTYGLRAGLLAMSNVWRGSGSDGALEVAAKGAPEAIARLCRLDAAEAAELTAAVDAMGDSITQIADSTAAVRERSHDSLARSREGQHSLQ